MAAVILALRQYPQGRANNKTTPTIIPLSLDGRGIKGLSQCLTLGSEGENDASHRHVIADLIRNPEG